MATAQILEDFQISSATGFLPQEPLLTRLPSHYEDWECICDHLHNLVKEKRIGEVLQDLKVLSTEQLTSYPDWRRAYVILGFLANGYLWGSEKPPNGLPPCIAVPFLQVSEHLSIPPVATYAAENLWNYRLIDPKGPRDNPDNIEALNSFTGSKDEAWFFALPTVIEARGAPIIPLALETFRLVSINNANAVVNNLREWTGHIHALSSLLPRLYENCDPDYFYNTIRPFLAGTTSAELPDGILYEIEDGRGSLQKLAGPTAAQSPLFHFMDLALGVEHHPLGVSYNRGERREETFLEKMRSYMAKPHRRFLAHIHSMANIREFVYASLEQVALTEAYNECLAALAAYRNKHIQIVSRYIVIPSRAASRKEIPETELGTAGRVLKDDNAKAQKESVALGTGGTAPVEFLKQVRNDTKASTV